MGLQDKPVELNQSSLGCGNGYAFVIGRQSAEHTQVAGQNQNSVSHEETLHQDETLEHLTQTD